MRFVIAPNRRLVAHLVSAGPSPRAAGTLRSVAVAQVLGLLVRAWTVVATPIVQTDKRDYAPHETVVITGSGFAAASSYDVVVIRPDGSIVKGDGSFMSGWDTVLSAASGSFVYLYQLDGIEGVYTVEVYASPWNGVRSTPLAGVTFTDAVGSDIKQLQNGGSVDTTPDWENGSINTNNSSYVEGESVPYRYEITEVPANACVRLDIHYEFTKGGIHAFDFLTDVDRTESSAIASAGGLFDGTSTGLTTASCNSTALTIPDDSTHTFDNAVAPQYITLCGGLFSPAP